MSSMRDAAQEAVEHVRRISDAVHAKPLTGITKEATFSAAVSLIGASLIANAIQETLGDAGVPMTDDELSQLAVEVGFEDENGDVVDIEGLLGE